MDPQGGEGNNQPRVVTPTAVVDRPLNAAVEPNVKVSSNPLDKLESVVAVAQQEAAAAQTTDPLQAPAESPKEQFENQFGSGVTPPVAETPELKPEDSKEAPVAQLDPSINTVDDLLAKGPQVIENPNPTAEVVSKPEDPQSTFVQDIKDAVEKLEKVTREKTAV